ncbi:alpha/beta hydrolase family esterase [Actinacidiphila guanduensis]|uniref:Polyhydroxybutyrate depolymerase n=1 Tax=Actinacidiphila guanduensis TaxID=310781 RepID=A0A1H0NCL2_9ACTN|nr:PHB depolymerase family esterase [Actinacidiphila guanduensis]SDO90427.1 polyhydroxybutyrate depolymerase [Actinacidiphila guanduensis]
MPRTPRRRRLRAAGAALLAAAAATATALTSAGTATAAAPAPSGVVDRAIPTTGCGLPPFAAPGSTTPQTLTTGGTTRSYVLHLPDGYRPLHPYQLVLTFHGRGKSGADQAQTTAVADRDTIAVYPQGLPGTGTKGEAAWPGAPYSTPAMDNDPLFVSDLITHLQRTLCVDPNRVMLAGKSNGGAFAALLACTMSRRIAALTVVSGALYGQHGCSPARAVPVLDFHGTGDTTIPYAGDPARDLPAIPDWTAQWAAQDGCTAGPRTFFQQDDVTAERWTGCRDRAEVEHYRIDGGGHVWPGSTTDGATQTVSATALMTAFVHQHPLTGRYLAPAL